MAIAIGLTGGCAQVHSGGPTPLFRGAGTAGPDFRASEVVPTAVIRGSNYTIEERVPVVDCYYDFRINTPDGVIPAHGMDMLELRLREMKSIQRLEQIRSQVEPGHGLTSAIEQHSKGLEVLVTDPGGAIGSVPEGLGRMIRAPFDAADRRAGSAERRQLAAKVG